jgi:hypothetical protein
MYRLPVWTYDRYENYGVHFVTLYFECFVGDYEPINMEPEKHEDWEWYSRRDLPSPLFSGVEAALAIAA